MANPESVASHNPNKYVPELNVKVRSRPPSRESQSEAPGVPPQAFEPWRDNRALGGAAF